MTPEQLKRLEALESDLLDAVLIDCQPKNWSGHGKTPKEMTKEERGNGAFERKSANLTMSLLARTVNILATHSQHTAGNIKDEESLEEKVKSIEKEARDRLSKLGLGDSSNNVH